jgi:hypothetical protein
MLLEHGYEPSHIRSLGHDLLKRAELARALGLNLRKRTFEHLGALGANREYLISRYGPELPETTSKINRLVATLKEVAKKTATPVGSVDSTLRPAQLCR